MTTVPGLNEYTFRPAEGQGSAGAAAKVPRRRPHQADPALCTSDTNDDGGKICPIIKQQLEAVGLKVDLMAMTHRRLNTYTADLANRENYDAEFIAGGGGIDPSSSSFHFACDRAATTTSSTARATWTATCGPVQQGPRRRSSPPATRSRTRSPRPSTISQPLLYLWQLSRGPRRQQARPGREVPSFDRYFTMAAYQWSTSQ